VDAGALARRIRSRGAELGLGGVGIAGLDPSDHAGFLKEWLAAGRAGEMGWMARTAEVRADPRRRFPWARIAVVAAVPYLPYRGGRHGQEGLVAHVARYAAGRDYHRVLGERLRALASFIEAEAPGARTRPYVDTGPVLERALAVRAGLGWFGKNTNLIGPRGDSWILLGQILTDLDLPPDDPVADRCGTCTACIDACPTAAIMDPYVVDSNRCISYLTIEVRGRIPPGRRADFGDWVFGCDVCQEVCPWNRKVEPSRDAPFLPGPHLADRSLEDLVRLDEPAFRQRFSETPLERPRRRGLVRNALIVAANTGDGPALQAAAGRLDDDDPVVRATAAWAVGRTGGPRDRAALERARAAETDPEVRAEIEAALERAA
jgi:epoxyqueuosine reductase